MKAQRKQLYDIDDDFDDIDGFDEPEPEPEPARAGNPPRRSVTLNDFFAPGLLGNSNTDSVGEEEDWGAYAEPDEEEQGDDYADWDRIQLCLTELGRKYEWEQRWEEAMVYSLRNLDYDVREFIRYDKENDKYLRPKKKLKVVAEPVPQKVEAHEMTAAKDLPRAKSPIIRSQSVAPMRQHGECHRSLAMVREQMGSTKKHLNLVIVGHVDAGKSTLMGHLLCLCGKVSHGVMTKLTQQSKQIGKQEDCFAWVMAEDQSEREHGITIDVAMTEFETPKLNVTILDAPGHKDFVPNMIAGASQADAVLLVVDVANPLIDRGQAREHLLLCRALGVNSLIVAVNKMDSVGFDESAFDDVKARLTTFLRTLGWAAIQYVPTAANTGDNLTKRSTNMPWYAGNLIFEAIDNLLPPAYEIEAPLLLCVSESTDANTKEATVSGRIEGGYVCKNDTVKILPGDKMVRVTSVKINGKPVQYATAGRIADISLAPVLGDIPIGSAIVGPENTLAVATQFKARIVTFMMQVPLLKGASLMFHRHAVDAPLKIMSICALVSKKTKQVEKKNPGYVPSNAMADVVFRVAQPLPMELHSISKSFGRFIIRAKGETLGFGSITEVIVNPSEAPRSLAAQWTL